MGDTITREQADELLKATVAQFEADVRRLVKVPINDNQGAALLSFHYNTGALAGSTLLKLLNNREYIRAGLEFIKWNKITVNGVKKVSQTLVKRRKQEQELFYKPIYHV
jgi:lysozyme